MLDDVLVRGLKIVFCGTAAGTASARRGQYYAGPGNKFWPVLHRIGLTPRQLSPAEFRDLPQFGLGLTDVVKEQSGSDVEIDFARSNPASLRTKLLEFRPRILAFNGKKAAQVFLGTARVEYGLQTESVESTLLFVLPSTSGAANGFWDEGWWEKLAVSARK